MAHSAHEGNRLLPGLALDQHDRLCCAYYKHGWLTRDYIMYVKLFASIYQGTLRGKSHSLLVFTNLLAHCDKTGDVDMHPRAIADEVGLTVDEVTAALAELEAPDPESRSPEENGRRIIRLDDHRAWGWRVVNYVKYRAIRDEADRREQNRMAQAAWRERNKPRKPASASVSQRKPESAQAEAEAEAKEREEVVERGVQRGEIAPARKRAVAPSCPSEVDQQVWSDWLALRKAKKAPVTATVVRSAIAEAAKAGMTLESFLRVWCARGSQGLQADWLKPHESQGNGAEPAWRTEQRERMQQFAPFSHAKRPPAAEPSEIINANAKRLD